jgi:DNA polymerase III subunit alpha
LFERFLNPERVSMPDFDIDFCQDRREEVIAYVRDRYGEDRVAQIITFGTLQARGVLRDVGRVLEMPYGQVDKLTKLVPQNPANPITLSQAIIDEPKLREAAREEPVVQRLLTIAQKLEGLHRHASTHAAGVVIGDRPLDELVPLVRDHKTGMRVSQFNMKWVEAAGLVKFDFLGLKTLTVLTKAVELIKRRGIEVVLEALPFDDPATYAMLRRGETVGVFQLESVGMRKALVEMNADRFEDLIALVALYRPGPMANIPTYCARKNGREKAEYLHPNLETVLLETHGIIVYQEQVMQAAQVLAGYSLGDADLLRRAMGKKIKSEMDAQRERFVSGATERGLSDALANEIFDLLAKFADYGFNKSHAAAYALVAYQTAYLKANYPVEFLAASMTFDMDNTDKLAEFRREAQRIGIVVEPPNIQTSDAAFEVTEGRIFYALAAIKGVGRQAIESLVKVRIEGGAFKDIGDLANRIDPRQVNRRTLEGLIAAGALDPIEPDRARATEAIDVILALAQRARTSAQGGQNELFGGMEPEPLRLPPHKPWLPAVRLQKEYAAVGFFLTGHPLDDYGSVLTRLGVRTWVDFCRGVRRGENVGKLAVSVLDRTERRTKSGSKMGIINLSDQTGHFEAIIFSEGLQAHRELLEAGNTLLISVQASLEGDEVRARILNAEPLDHAAAQHQKGMSITIEKPECLASIKEHLAQSSRQESGSKTGSVKKGHVNIRVRIPNILPEKADATPCDVDIRLSKTYTLTPHIASVIRMVSGVKSVELM